MMDNKQTFSQILEDLNTTPESRQLIDSYNRLAKRENFTPEQYEAGREVVFLLAIKASDKTFKTLSGHVWKSINNS